MKTYQEAREFIQNKMSLGSVLGLENIKELLRRMDNPQNHLKFVHVAGTNGKGSIVSYVSEVLKDAGYQIGKYISPTILGYRERIQVNNLWITEDEFAEGIEKISEKISHMVEDGYAHPTVFEIETALAFWHFCEKKCDVVMLEAGMGGSLDATNIISEAICYVFASISMDHTDYLGDTLEEIAENKAGIIKPNGTVVTGVQKPFVLEVLKKKANKKACDFVLADMSKVTEVKHYHDGQAMIYDNIDCLRSVESVVCDNMVCSRSVQSVVYEMRNQEKVLIEIPLLGIYQIQNAVTALAVVEVLQEQDFIITKENIINGISNTKWFGRFTKVSDKPLFFVDGAHNKEAAENLRKTLVTYFPGKKFIYIIGVFQDKDYNGILEQTVDLAKKIYTVTAPGPRGIPAEKLKEIIKEYHNDVVDTESVEDAIVKSRKNSEDEIIIAFGSLSYLGDIFHYFEY